MQNFNIVQLIKKHWEVIALISGIAMVFALLVTLMQPFQYEASTRLLVIQKQGAADAYTSVKSAEKIAQNLSTILYTSSFYNDVIDANPSIADEFSKDTIERRKEWESDIETSIVGETGILTVSAYNESKDVSAQIVRTIAHTLVTKGQEYHGGGSSVEMKIVDDVLVSKFPQRPNVILNMVAAAVFGMFVGLIFIIWKYGRSLQTQMVLQSGKKDIQKDEEEKEEDKGWIIVDAEDPKVYEEYAYGKYKPATSMHDHLSASKDIDKEL